MTDVHADQLAAFHIFQGRHFGPADRPLIDGVIAGGSGVFADCVFEDVEMDFREITAPADIQFFRCEFISSPMTFPEGSAVVMDGEAVNP